jgi:glycosyltransferase involved in cell wall biosynthesis
MREQVVEARSQSVGEPNLGKPIRVLATFFHGSVQGEQISGSVKRFLEVSKALSLEGISLSTFEFSPSLTRSTRSRGQSFGFPGGWEPISLGYLVNLLRRSLFSVVWGRRLRCDVVYAPDSMRDQLIPAFFVSLLLRKPLVVVVHSLHVEEVRISLGNLFKSQLKSNKGLKKAFARTVIEILLRMGYRRASAFLAVSGSTAKQVAGELHPRRIVVSGNGVGDDWFELPQTPKTQDACFLGMVSPEKRQKLLIHAWKEVSLERPDATLVLVGAWRGRAYANQCDALIRDLGLEKNVIMTGFVDDTKARSWVTSSRIFLSATTWEGFGLSILEAMAAGIPCIVSDIPALRETFGGTALLVDGSDPRVWAEKVLGLLEDSERLDVLSTSGRSLATKFRWGMVGKKEAELIQSLANTQKHTHVRPIGPQATRPSKALGT